MSENKKAVNDVYSDFCATIKQHYKVILIFLFFIAHTISMALIPAIKHNWNWSKVEEIWWSWQTYNSAVIALLASFIAYSATTYAYKKDQDNNFRAAKSKMPQALSDLIAYTKKCASIHSDRYKQAKISPFLPLNYYESYPSLPDSATNTIVECIRYADPYIGSQLATIIEDLQVITSRIAPPHHSGFFQRMR